MTLIFQNRHVLVTGGGRGIGAAIASQFAALGASLSLIGRNKKVLEEKAAELNGEFGIHVFSYSADVSDHAQVIEAFDAAENQHGQIEFLINNAGQVESAPFSKTTSELWRKMVGINLDGVYFGTSYVIPKMLESGFGRVVNIASTAGLTGYRYVSAYCAAKHGVVGFTKALALETAGKGITVNAVCPGYTDTDLVSEAAGVIAGKTQQTVEEIKQGFVKGIPQGRFVRPQEVAAAVSWLCEDSQGSITGATINISGGEIL
ncbi:MAG: SDR family oxidoreductase [Bdellovibrionales bacterium]|nr:SDR family oxidoreductase [Bdellovibrionales bacterium]